MTSESRYAEKTMENEPSGVEVIPSAANANTPMMQQYFSAKAKHPDALMFFRLGDFYELFFEDAILAAKLLQITLTHRGKNQDNIVPMCGVPYHAYEHYTKKLIDLGYKIALCEQIETPEERLKHGGKGPLARDVVRLITPSTVVEASFLENTAAHFLLSVVSFKKKKGSIHVVCAYMDISAHMFVYETVAFEDMLSVFSRLQAKEILMQDAFYAQNFELFSPYRRVIQALSSTKFDEKSARNRLHRLYELKTLQSLETLEKAEIQALGAVLDYIEIAYKDALKHLPFPKKIENTDALILDHQTRTNLELDLSQGKREGSLFHALNTTQTPGGGRLLHRYVMQPTRNQHVLNERLDALTYFFDAPECAEKMRFFQRDGRDLTRSLSRFFMKRGGPLDLGVVVGALDEAAAIMNTLNECEKALPFSIPTLPFEILNTLKKALTPELPVHTREGGFIQRGYNTALDELKKFTEHGEQSLFALQERYKTELGIPTLKVKQNNVAGYFIEVPLSQKNKIPEDFFHKQTLTGNVRYTTKELDGFALKIEHAAQEALQLELQIFDEIVQGIIDEQDALFAVANFLNFVDVFSSFALFSLEKKYVRPLLVQEPMMHIEKGRHPVLDDENYVPNDLNFSKDAGFYLLTGPNMAGKSTYLRQAALITLMAHTGLYVPAEKAIIGLTDRIFSRIGAGDNLAAGMSTFMVEMVETATILHHATKNSLIILDELGRGTSTYDGLSLAWSVTETLEKLGARTLFATHYFELTKLEKTLATLLNLRLATKEWEGKIHFLHKVESGAAHRSYGLHVAGLAGVPKGVIKRATEILNTFEKKESEQTQTQLRLHFPETKPKECSILSELQAIDVNQLTPLEALQKIAQLQEMFDT